MIRETFWHVQQFVINRNRNRLVNPSLYTLDILAPSQLIKSKV